MSAADSIASAIGLPAVPEGSPASDDRATARRAVSDAPRERDVRRVVKLAPRSRAGFRVASEADPQGRAIPRNRDARSRSSNRPSRAGTSRSSSFIVRGVSGSAFQRDARRSREDRLVELPVARHDGRGRKLPHGPAARRIREPAPEAFDPRGATSPRPPFRRRRPPAAGSPLVRRRRPRAGRLSPCRSTGTPHAIASSAARPKDSASEGRRKRSAIGKQRLDRGDVAEERRLLREPALCDEPLRERLDAGRRPRGSAARGCAGGRVEDARSRPRSA